MEARDPLSTASADRADPLERVEIHVEGTQGIPAWRSLMATLVDWRKPWPPVADTPFDASLSVYNFGFFLVCRMAGDGGRLSRGPAAIGLDDHDHFVITVVLRGRIGFAGPAGGCQLRPGDVAIVDLRSKLDCVMSPGEAIHLIVPRTFLPPAVAPPDATAPRVLRAGHVASHFLTDLAQMLVRMPSYAGRGEALGLASALRTPIAFCFGAPRSAGEATGASRLANEMRRYIEDNLAGNDLTPAVLLKRFAVSRTQLFRHFQTSGGVETYIRQRRLRRALMALADPLLSNRRIGEIAYDAGFIDEAHFSRLFKHSYGSTPRAFRMAARKGLINLPPHTQQAGAEQLSAWLTGLSAAR